MMKFMDQQVYLLQMPTEHMNILLNRKPRKETKICSSNICLLRKTFQKYLNESLSIFFLQSNMVCVLLENV